MSRTDEEAYIDHEAVLLAQQLESKFQKKTHLYEAIDIPRETYRDWFRRGLTSRRWGQVKMILKNALAERRASNE